VFITTMIYLLLESHHGKLTHENKSGTA